MLISLVRDSVLKCFCHTCSANSAITGRHFQKKPLSKKTNKKPRCKQPKRKKSYHATEIRCEEKSRGGMSYEMVLADSISDKPEQPNVIIRQKSTVEDINEKLQKAEERRKSLEAIKMTSITERLAKLEEASRKREEANKSFIVASQAALEQKIDITSANRDNHFAAIKVKVEEHLKGVANVRKMLDNQSEELKDTIQLKLANAQENRDEYFNKIMEKLKIHDDHAEKVSLRHDQSIRQLEKNIEKKLNDAELRRASEQKKKLEILKEHERRAEKVRANKEKFAANGQAEIASSG